MSKLPWHGPLYPVKGHLAERYALALREISGDKLPVESFGVDRLGWSPQIAAVLGDDYLGGDALRSAIILSPDQAEAPPLRRRFSYEAALIERVYLEARPTLLSLVADQPVIVELDNGLPFCRTATDVLNIQQARATVDTPQATLANSRALLELGAGLGEGARLLDERYIQRMLALANEVGDPRRRVQPPELSMAIGSLWADVYGGVYVLRPPARQQGETIVIAVRLDAAIARMPVRSLALDDPAVIGTLQRAGWLRYPPANILLKRRLGELEAEALLEAGEEPAVDAGARRKQLARSQGAQASLGELYWELDAEQKRVAAGGEYAPEKLSAPARWALSAPARDPDVIGHLLARFVRFDYRLFVNHHRRSLEAEWPRYSAAKQRYLQAQFPYMVEGFVRKAS
jgi:hypothetical protein